MKHTWKKTTAFVMALALVAGFAPANVGGFLTGGTAIVASAAEEVTEPAAVGATVERNGLTYYNTYSTNTDSAKMFYQDLIDGKFDGFKYYSQFPTKECLSTNDFSIGDMWLILASSIVGASKIAGTHTCIGHPDDVQSAIGFFPRPELGSANVITTSSRWVNTDDGGYVEKNLYYTIPGGDTDVYTVRFSNFKVVTLMPENEGTNYVSTRIESVDNSPAYATSLKNDTAMEVSGSQSLSSSTEYSLSNSVSHSKSFSFSEGIEATQKLNLVATEYEVKESFSATQAIENGWEKGESLSNSSSTDSSVSITLPPYTNSMIKQSQGVTTVTTKYNCPVAIKYTVELLQSYKGNTVTLAHFGATNGDARADLYQRGVVERPDNSDREIWWNSTSSSYAPIEKIVYNIPMSSFGATMIETVKTVNTVAAPVAPLYPLTSVESTKQELALTVGETAYTNDIDLKGLNMYRADYYGFNPAYGHWIVTDENGIELENAPIKLNTNSVSKKTAINTISAGTCYLKYVIDENSYATAENTNTYTKNSDLSATAMVKVTVKEDENTAKKPKITAKYSPEELAGKFGREHYDLDDYFDVDFKDSTGRDVDYIWEAQERTKKGIAFDENNSVYFTKNGVFHVRVRDPESGIYSDWIEITGIVQAGDEEPLAITVPDEPIVDADENTSFVISGSYTGLVGAEPDMLEGEPAIELYDENDEPVYTHGRLQFDAYDKSNKEMNIAYSWEAQETEGITLTEDGKVSFTSPGTYHIRAKSGEYASDWYVINAKNTSEEYSTVWFLDADGTLIKAFFQPWGSELKAPAVPEHKGFIFDGWDNEVPSAMPADDMTITAIWKVDESVERILIRGNTRGLGSVEASADGSEPVFDDEHPITSLHYNVVKGESVIFSAKADEGWVFREWQHRATGEVFSKDATITITAGEPLDLVAVFDAEDAITHKLTDAKLMQWSQKDYQDKTGTTANAAITGWSDTEYEITLTDDDDNVLDTYTVNPDTGVGTDAQGKEVNLPQTGMSGAHKAFAGLAALMTIAGFGLVKKSKKKDEE
ncbi:MAG: LPXTG cell wall anchor domain-containing protein [Ruminococcus flavefaciens]|jgi:LPXTG-motif cell wall-anchored protein|nr:LPXTG cell wall anchor domain-containing protein [Ruminococcus flavefaciens]